MHVHVHTSVHVHVLRESVCGYMLRTQAEKLELDVWSKADCSKTLQGWANKYRAIQNKVICAGGEEGEDACQGDSGAPPHTPLLSQPVSASCFQKQPSE